MAAAGFAGCGRTGQLDDLRVEAHVLGVPDGQQAQREQPARQQPATVSADAGAAAEARAARAAGTAAASTPPGGAIAIALISIIDIIVVTSPRLHVVGGDSPARPRHPAFSRRRGAADAHRPQHRCHIVCWPLRHAPAERRAAVARPISDRPRCRCGWSARGQAPAETRHCCSSAIILGAIRTSDQTELNEWA